MKRTVVLKDEKPWLVTDDREAMMLSLEPRELSVNLIEPQRIEFKIKQRNNTWCVENRDTLTLLLSTETV